MAQPLRVVLIEPEYAGNLGSVARAMGNMGFDRLVLVKPKARIDHNDAKAMAMSAYPILEKATLVDSLPEAIQDCHWVAGFTRRAGRHRRQFLPMPELATTVQSHLQTGEKTAFMFGPERRGFTTREASLCQHLIQIPTSKKIPSLNLAQAVIIALYEVARAKVSDEVPFPHKAASVDKVEGMYAHLDELLEGIRYFDAQNRERIPMVLRRLFNRARPTPQEVRIIRGICRNALNAIRKKKN